MKVTATLTAAPAVIPKPEYRGDALSEPGIYKLIRPFSSLQEEVRVIVSSAFLPTLYIRGNIIEKYSRSSWSHMLFEKTVGEKITIEFHD